jgi:hypothetical protein
LTAAPTLGWLVPSRQPALRWLVIALFVAARPLVAGVSVASTAREVAARAPDYRRAAEWLEENAAGSAVFNADYAAYGPLRYHGGGFDLVQGLDPVFIAARDPERQRLITKAVEGRLTLEEFGAAFLRHRFVVVEKGQPLSRIKFHRGRIAYSDSQVLVIDVDGKAGSTPSAH